MSSKKYTLSFLCYLVQNQDIKIELTADQKNLLKAQGLYDGTRLTSEGDSKAMAYAKRMIDPLYKANYEKVFRGRSIPSLIKMLFVLLDVLVSNKKAKLFSNQRDELIQKIKQISL